MSKFNVILKNPMTDVAFYSFVIDTDTTYKSMDIGIGRNGIMYTEFLLGGDYAGLTAYKTTNERIIGISLSRYSSTPPYLAVEHPSLGDESHWLSLESLAGGETGVKEAVDFVLYVFTEEVIEGKYGLSTNNEISINPNSLWGNYNKTYNVRCYTGGVLCNQMFMKDNNIDERYELYAKSTSYGEQFLLGYISYYNAYNFEFVSDYGNSVWFLDDDAYIDSRLAWWIKTNFINKTTGYDIVIKSNDGATTFGSVSGFIKGTDNAPKHVFVKVNKLSIELINNGVSTVIYTHQNTNEFLGISGQTSSTTCDYAVDDILTIGEAPDSGFSYTFYVVVGEGYTYYMVQNSTLKAIANAIRSKTGKSGDILVKDFASVIESIPIKIWGRWKFNDTISWDDTVEFTGSSNGEYRGIVWDSENGTLHISTLSGITPPIQIYDQIIAYQNGSWDSTTVEDYKIVNFGNISQNTNANFIAFMEANATRVEDSSSSSVGFITDDEIDDLINSI